jgi:cytochrome c-type biogenesis protein CcmE
MKEFLASVAAMIVIAIVAALVLGGIDSSAAEFFMLPQSVRL